MGGDYLNQKGSKIHIHKLQYIITFYTSTNNYPISRPTKVYLILILIFFFSRECKIIFKVRLSILLHCHTRSIRHYILFHGIFILILVWENNPEVTGSTMEKRLIYFGTFSFFGKTLYHHTKIYLKKKKWSKKVCSLIFHCRLSHCMGQCLFRSTERCHLIGSQFLTYSKWLNMFWTDLVYLT